MAAFWPAVVLAAGAAMLGWGWLRWPDPLIDFGRELYVPWRLLAGDTLYVDLAYFNGPLSPYLNALWFRLFGVGLHTLAACNVVLAALLAAVLLYEISRLTDRLAACVAGVVFVCAFGFTQLDTIGNYNYVTPYSHEVTHGLLLGALAIFASVHASGAPRTGAALSGLALGLCFLTKAEVFVAAAVGVGVAQGLTVASEPRLGVAAARRGGALVAALLAPIALAVALLATRMPLASAFHGALGSWAYLFESSLTSLPFYRWGLGTLQLGDNLWSLASWTAALLILFGASAAIALTLRTPPWKGLAAVVTAAGAGAWVFWGADEVSRLVRPLPLVLPALAAIFAVRWWRSADDGALRRIEAARVAWIVWALVLLAKIFFNVRLTHYGFALAMPGTLILVAVLVHGLPRAVEARGGAGSSVRATALATIAASLGAVLLVAADRFSWDSPPLGKGADRFHTQRRGHALARALEAIDEHLEPHETLAVLPEGVMLNYLTRRVNPTGHLNFMPPELIIFGEGTILQSFRDQPPDFVMLAHKSTLEYGHRFFGRDYAQTLGQWITGHYRPVWQVGAVPLTSRYFGLQLLERNDRTASAPTR
jgi:4-amino-4-deoxy-L-arabinose transferase-like glycosyltransferase